MVRAAVPVTCCEYRSRTVECGGSEPRGYLARQPPFRAQRPVHGTPKVMYRRYVVIGFCAFDSAPLIAPVIAPILISRVLFQISTVLNIYSNVQLYCTAVNTNNIGVITGVISVAEAKAQNPITTYRLYITVNR